MEAVPLKPLRESYRAGPLEVEQASEVETRPSNGTLPQNHEGHAAGAPGGVPVRVWAGLKRRCLAWDDKGRTSTVVNLSSIMERVDEVLLPALYRFVGAAFGERPSQLGRLTLSRALVQALASPLVGVLGHWWVLWAVVKGRGRVEGSCFMQAVF